MPKNSCISPFKVFISILLLICLQIVFPDMVLMKICITSRLGSLVARFVYCVDSFANWFSKTRRGAGFPRAILRCSFKISGGPVKIRETLTSRRMEFLNRVVQGKNFFAAEKSIAHICPEVNRGASNHKEPSSNLPPLICSLNIPLKECQRATVRTSRGRPRGGRGTISRISFQMTQTLLPS